MSHVPYPRTDGSYPSHPVTSYLSLVTYSMRAPCVPIAFAFLLGVLIAVHLPCALLLVISGSILSLALIIPKALRRHIVVPSLLGLWVCCGMLRLIVWQAHPTERLQAILSDAPQLVRLHGIVRDDPVELFNREALDLETCVLDLRHVEIDGGWRPIAGRVRATIQQPSVPLAYGDEALIEGRWSRVPSPGNPGQYDWRAALARQHIHGLLRIVPAHRVVVLRHRQGRWWLAAIFHLRHRWEQLIQELADPRDVGVLRSLLLGERVALDDTLRQAFVETGTIHLLVISGFNVGLIAGLLELLFRLMGIPWRWRLGLCAIGLGGYCVLTGLQPPVARATLMAWVVFGAYALDRVISWPNTLAVAALIILWVNPTQLFDPGFQLSFGAVASLLIFTTRWYAWLEPHLRWIHPNWLRRYISLSLVATSAIWIGLSPILAWYFHLVAPVSMPANLLLAPQFSVLISYGTAMLMLGTLCPSMVRWGSGALTFMLHAMLRCVSWCHAIPGGYWFVGHPSLSLLLGYYGLLILTILRHRVGLSRRHVFACWMVGLAVWGSSILLVRVLNARWLRVDVLDVGHGDCIIVRTPKGQTVVVDTGSQQPGRYRVMPFLRYEGVSSIDALVLTHTDEDHLGGAIPILQTMRVKRLLTNGVRGDTMSSREVLQLADARHVEQTVLAAGDVLAKEKEMAIDVLHPPRDLVPDAPAKSNDNSVVLRLTQGDVSILLSGDIEERGLPWLLRSDAPLRSTVLKVPHHGSRLHQVGEAFFDAVQPRIAILSVGWMHHLPSAEIMDALERIGAARYLTRDDGAISLRTDGSQLHITTFRTRRHDVLRIHNPPSSTDDPLGHSID